MQYPEKTVAGIAYSLVDTQIGFDPAFSGDANRLARFLLRQLRSVPDYIRPAFYIFIIILDVAPVFLFKRPFHRMNLAQKRKYLEAWRKTPVRPLKDFIGFFDSFGILFLAELLKQKSSHEKG